MMVTCLARTARTLLACTTTFSKSFLGFPRGARRSTDGGRRWTRTSIPDQAVTFLATNEKVPGAAVAFAEPDSTGGGIGHGGIWASRDWGRTWRRINAGLAGAFSPIGLAVMPGRPFTVLFGTSNGIHRSADGGRTWTTNNLGGTPVLSLALSARQPRTVFAGAANGIWESTDEGATWRRIFTGPPTSALLAASDSALDLYGFASLVHPYIYRLESGRHVMHGTTPVTGGQIVIAVDPTNAARIYAGFSFPLRIYESTNSGRSWRKIL
jgi:photosystem II stability/assembly factor-like uncharacterized protein